ncbi:hypothetical protein HDF10_003095 [Edaphobacter lichenicola]|uniref:Uncharacterized protein n=1 Tax=Tunturiibacter lichenicola TaxID=2051959 RepID=A0A7W8JC20_9BACT|nr:hypothetical protein [Edaphobacter lichenicola]
MVQSTDLCGIKPVEITYDFHAPAHTILGAYLSVGPQCYAMRATRLAKLRMHREY